MSKFLPIILFCWITSLQGQEQFTQADIDELDEMIASDEDLEEQVEADPENFAESTSREDEEGLVKADKDIQLEDEENLETLAADDPTLPQQPVAEKIIPKINKQRAHRTTFELSLGNTSIDVQQAGDFGDQKSTGAATLFSFHARRVKTNWTHEVYLQFYRSNLPYNYQDQGPGVDKNIWSYRYFSSYSLLLAGVFATQDELHYLLETNNEISTITTSYWPLIGLRYSYPSFEEGKNLMSPRFIIMAYLSRPFIHRGADNLESSSVSGQGSFFQAAYHYPIGEDHLSTWYVHLSYQLESLELNINSDWEGSTGAINVQKNSSTLTIGLTHSY